MAPRFDLEGPKGKRELPLEKFFVIPKTENEREHDLRPNEIVTELVIPPAPDLKAAHYEIRQKEAFDWPLAVAAVTLKTAGLERAILQDCSGICLPHAVALSRSSAGNIRQTGK